MASRHPRFVVEWLDYRSGDGARDRRAPAWSWRRDRARPIGARRASGAAKIASTRSALIEVDLRTTRRAAVGINESMACSTNSAVAGS